LHRWIHNGVQRSKRTFLKKYLTTTGDQIRSLKKCTKCTTLTNSFKLRNRDLNASINIWIITEKELKKEERPGYLTRPQKKQKTQQISK
jgi:protein involved in temperature-dependent protein secretion